MNTPSRVIIHVGYPKCMSTTLQHQFFKEHPDIWYGGIGISDNISYITKEVEFLFEILLKYSRHSFFDRYHEEVSKHISNLVSDKEVAVFSSEHLSMNFSPQGIDQLDKLKRLRRIFSSQHVEVLIFTRNRDDLLNSIYGELVRMGYYESLEEFKRWVVQYQDRNFFEELDYENSIRQFNEFFEKVHVIDFDDFRSLSNKAMNKMLSEKLDIPVRDLDLSSRMNVSLSNEEQKLLRDINNQDRRGVGCSIFEPFEKHRNRTLFDILNLSLEEKEIYSNVIQKRSALQKLNASRS